MTTVEPQRVTRSYCMTLHAGVERVFPLLCPVREHEYLDDWNATILYSESGVAEPGCVFQTPKEGGPPTTWYIAEHDPAAGKIVFVTFTPASRVSQLAIRVRENSGGATEATFTYTHTAIAPDGRDFVGAFTQDVFLAKMRAFEHKLNEYLESHEDE